MNWRVVVALERPNSGAVTLGGVDVSKLHGSELRRKRRDLQLMFQDPHSSLDPRMRVGTIIGESSTNPTAPHIDP